MKPWIKQLYRFFLIDDSRAVDYEVSTYTHKGEIFLIFNPKFYNEHPGYLKRNCLQEEISYIIRVELERKK